MIHQMKVLLISLKGAPVKEEGWRQLGAAHKNTAYVSRVVKFQNRFKEHSKVQPKFYFKHTT